MSFDIKIKGKEHQIKFNYALNFKANKKLASKNDEGISQNDGAGILFVQVLEKEDDALINLIQLVDNKATENDAVEAVENYVEELIAGGLNEEEAYAKIFDDLKDEMVASGFFVTKIRKYNENLEKAVDYLNNQKKEDNQMQISELKKLVEKIKKEIS